MGRTSGGSAAALAAAVRRAAKLLGREVSDLTAIEVHVGSAAFCLAVARELELALALECLEDAPRWATGSR